jgi:methylisocitrate lyase
LLSLTEIADVTRRITQRCGLGLIVDIGVGFGDAVHATRAVWELEQAGAAAIEIEDQVAPKRVSHHRGIEHLVDISTMVQKIREVAAARRDAGFAIIARTGAVRNESFEAALTRLQAYRNAGADVLMLMPESDEQVHVARAVLPGPLATITAMDHAHAPRWRDSGWNLIIDPFTAQVLSVQAVQKAYGGFVRDGSSGADLKALFGTYGELGAMAGLPELYAIEDRTTES